MGNLLNQKLGHTRPAVIVVGADGALPPVGGWTVVYITKGSAAALTLANPGVEQDGVRLEIISTTAQAHTVDNSAGAGFNGGGAAADVGTFGAAIGNNLVLTAYNGVWWILASLNITLG